MMESSKERERKLDRVNKEQFSPVNKLLGTKTMHGRNLTGTARHVRDLTADIHANIQQWNDFHLRGVKVLENITQEKQDESYSQTLQELCNELENVIDAMEPVVKNLNEIARQMRVIASLDDSANKLFGTWPATKFGDIAEIIYAAYSHELEVRRKVLEDVAHYHAASWKMLFRATWVHQTLLPQNLTMLLESLLVETGHR